MSEGEPVYYVGEVKVEEVITNLREQVNKAEARISSLEKKVVEKDEVIQSLHQLIRSRKSIEALEIGQQVGILDSGISKARIEKVHISKSGVSYTVVYWHERGKMYAEVQADEVIADTSDTLFLPGQERK